MKRIVFFIVAGCCFLVSKAQEKWDLQQCVEYAIKNNISVRQTDLQSRFSALTFTQNKASQLPSLNFSTSSGFRFGRSENPTTGVLEDNNFFNLGVQLNTQVNLFNWFSAKNNTEASRLQWEADKAQTEKIANDIALNVAIAYLQVLLAREQSQLALVQLAQSQTQWEVTRKKVDAGILPELSAAELEAQIARDSSSLISTQTTASQFLLQLKALLNLDAGAPFDIATPPIETIPVEALGELQPELVYQSALSFLPQQKVNELKILSAKKTVEAVKGNLYPSFSAFGSLGTNYVNIRYPEYQVGPYTPSGAKVNVSGTDYDVLTPSMVIVGDRAIPLGRQFNSNFSQNIGIGMSVPIFNGKSARTNVERSQLTVQQLMLDKEQGEQQLKQDIYKAYIDATAALQKFNAEKKAAETAERAFGYAQKRFELNLLSSFELLNSQNNMQTSKIQALYAQYDYVFKMKMLEFYKGQGLKL